MIFSQVPLDALFKTLQQIDHYGTWLMPSGVIIGLLFPNLTILTKPFAETTVILMLTVSIFRLDPEEILIAFSNIRLLFCGTFFILIIIPLLIFLATILINIPAELKAILVAGKLPAASFDAGSCFIDRLKWDGSSFNFITSNAGIYTNPSNIIGATN